MKRKLRETSLEKIVKNPRRFWIRLFKEELLFVLAYMISDLRIRVYEIVNPSDKDGDKAWFDWKKKEIVIIIGNRKRFFSEGSLVFVLYHEILHFIQRHHLRIGNRNPKKWNIACDIWINNLLREISQKSELMEVPKDIVLEDIVGNPTEEEIYNNKFGNNDKGDNSENKKQDGDSSSDHDSDNKHTDKDITSREIEYEFPDGTIEKRKVIDYDGKEIDDMNDYNNDDVKEFKRKMRNTAKQVSHVTASLQDKIDLSQFIGSNVDPKLILEKAIRSCFSNDGRGWTRPNILLRKRYTAPGLLRKQKTKRMMIAIDTSASMGQDELDILNEVISKLSIHFSAIDIIEADSRITNEETLETKYRKIRGIPIKSVSGGGCTSHKEVFDKFEKLDKSEYSVIVAITDGESDIEEIWNDYTFYRRIPTVFVLTGIRNLDVKYAKIVNINI